MSRFFIHGTAMELKYYSLYSSITINVIYVQVDLVENIKI